MRAFRRVPTERDQHLDLRVARLRELGLERLHGRAHLLVESGKTSSWGRPGGELLRPRRASKLLRRRSGVRRSGLSPGRHQAGRWGGGVRRVDGVLQQLAGEADLHLAAAGLGLDARDEGELAWEARGEAAR